MNQNRIDPYHLLIKKAKEYFVYEFQQKLLNDLYQLYCTLLCRNQDFVRGNNQEILVHQGVIQFKMSDYTIQ